MSPRYVMKEYTTYLAPLRMPKRWGGGVCARERDSSLEKLNSVREKTKNSGNRSLRTNI